MLQVGKKCTTKSQKIRIAICITMEIEGLNAVYPSVECNIFFRKVYVKSAKKFITIIII